jgi:Protein of unknown function (DUF3237)
MADAKDDIIPVDLAYAFSIRIDFKERILVPGPMQTNVYVPAAGGSIWGPRLQGKVVPYSGADYGGEFGLDAHYMLQADDGTYIYIHNQGYLYRLNSDRGMAQTPPTAPVKPEDQVNFSAPASADAATYFRITPYFNAPVGPHDWLARTVIVGTGERFQNPDHTIFTYYAVL